MMSTTTTMIIIIITMIIIIIIIIRRRIRIRIKTITVIIIMTVRPSKIRVIINKQFLFNKIISAKPIAHFKKKTAYLCVLTIPSFFKSFRRGLTKLGNRIYRLLSCVISYVIHSDDDRCTVETCLLILKKVALFLKIYVTPVFQTGVFCREGGTSS